MNKNDDTLNFIPPICALVDFKSEKEFPMAFEVFFNISFFSQKLENISQVVLSPLIFFPTTYASSMESSTTMIAVPVFVNVQLKKYYNENNLMILFTTSLRVQNLDIVDHLFLKRTKILFFIGLFRAKILHNYFFFTLTVCKRSQQHLDDHRTHVSRQKN